MTTPGSTDQYMQCGSLNCSVNAKCINASATTYKCQCHAGFSGDTCHDDIDECNRGNPCYHRGVCHNTIGSWWCECLDGWNGTEHCGENITESRLCMPGWTGEWCETCADDELGCGYMGRCGQLHNGNYYCGCQSGYGRRPPCADVDECTSNPCRNSGSCINTVGSYICLCASGWTGTQCNDDIDECASIPCQNQGVCIDHLASYSCNCTSGWKGLTCAEDIDECLASPCLHSGICTNNKGSFQCACTPEWAGPTCSEKNICHFETPCSNTGNCTHINQTAYLCQCPDTWKGVNCTDDVDECAENKCKNGASCNNTIGSYSCTCAEGWEGDNCDTDLNECESSNPCNATLVCVNVDGSYTCEAKIVKDDSGGANIGIIAGATTGALLAILAAVLALLYKFKWKRNPPLNKVSDVNGKGKTEVGNKHFKQPIKE
ncbi:Matrilin-4 [Mactra antiquata]